MNEILAAAIGALIGGILLWLVSRYRPTYLLCEEKYRSQLGFPLPEGAFVFRGTPVTNLSLLNLDIRNTGHTVIPDPHVIIRIDEGARILASSLKFTHPPAEPAPDPQINGNVVRLSLPALYPYALNKELVTVTIFADKEIVSVAADGKGRINGGTPWSVRFKPISAESERRFRIATQLNRFVLPYIAIALFYVLFIRPPTGTVQIDPARIQLWASDPILWVLTACFVLWWLWISYLLLKGHYAFIPLPFQGTEIRFYLKKE